MIILPFQIKRKDERITAGKSNAGLPFGKVHRPKYFCCWWKVLQLRFLITSGRNRQTVKKPSFFYNFIKFRLLDTITDDLAGIYRRKFLGRQPE